MHKTENGRVIVKFLRFYNGYGSGELAGFPEEDARRIVEEHQVAVYADPDGNALDLPIPEEPEPSLRQARARKEKAKESEDPNDAKSPSDVPIPEDWESAEWMSNYRLATQLNYGEKPKNKEAAYKIIRDEVARRRDGKDTAQA